MAPDRSPGGSHRCAAGFVTGIRVRRLWTPMEESRRPFSPRGLARWVATAFRQTSCATISTASLGRSRPASVLPELLGEQLEHAQRPSEGRDEVDAGGAVACRGDQLPCVVETDVRRVRARALKGILE
jgi:hypothetical protein